MTSRRLTAAVTTFGAALLAVAFLASCGARTTVGPPPAAPVMDRPASAIPGDLDVAIRLDLAAARRLFGPGIARALQFEVTDPAEDARTAALVSAAVARADVLWVAFRPGLAAHLTDNVLVLRGAFGGIEPDHGADGADGADGPAVAAHRSTWSLATDLGGGFRVYERPAPKRRSAPSRIYARVDDWLVLASEAEVDGAERAIALRAGDEHVDPPERGLASVSARVPPLVPLLAPGFPLVAEALARAVRVEGTADADDRGLRATLEIRYRSEEDAVSGRARLLPLFAALRKASGPVGHLARGAEATTAGPVLVVAVILDGPGLAALIACLDGEGGRGC